MTLFKTPGAEDKAAEYLAKVEEKFSKDGSVDVEALKMGKAESDWFIEQLQKETAEMREELNKRTTYDELMAKIEAQRDTSRVDEIDGERDDNPTNKGVDIENLLKQVDSRAEQKFIQKQQEAKAKQNVDSVQTKLVEVWGTNYVSKLKSRVAELEMTEDEASNMAATRPKAFLAMLDPVAVKKQEFTPPRSNVQGKFNSTSSDDPVEKFEKLRKENPKAYWSTEVQNEIHRLALAKARASS